MKADQRFIGNSKYQMGDFVSPCPMGGAYVAIKASSKQGNSDIFVTYVKRVNVADLSEKDQRRWAKYVLYNDILADSYIPGTENYIKREISNQLTNPSVKEE